MSISMDLGSKERINSLHHPLMLFKLHYLIGRDDKLIWQAETMISHFVWVIKMFNILVYCWI